MAAAIEETGIPFKVLTVPFPASTPYVDIVRAMSDTGILVGATDASLFAAAYLPAHSVLIEMLPAGTRRTTFRYLAEAKVGSADVRSAGRLSAAPSCRRVRAPRDAPHRCPASLARFCVGPRVSHRLLNLLTPVASAQQTNPSPP